MFSLLHPAGNRLACRKHGDQPFVAYFDRRPFCPRCIADFFEKEIGFMTFAKKENEQ